MGNVQIRHANESSTRYGMVNVSKKQVTHIPSEFANKNEMVKTADLSYNKIKIIPIWIGTFKKLKILNLKSNKISKLPDEIGECINLEKLDVSLNSITIIPEKIGNLKLLKTVNFSDNNIEKVEKNIFDIINLKSLDLSNNVIKLIEADLSSSQLIELNLNNNLLTSFPQNIHLAPKLKILRIEKNQLSLNAFVIDFFIHTKLNIFQCQNNLFQIKNLDHFEGYNKLQSRTTLNLKKLD